MFYNRYQSNVMNFGIHAWCLKQNNSAVKTVFDHLIRKLMEPEVYNNLQDSWIREML